MRVIMNREPKDYLIDGTTWSLKPASKDEISACYREAMYEREKGTAVENDPHTFEKIILAKFCTGWKNLIDDNDADIPFNKEMIPAIINNMDQRDRDSIFSPIFSPSKAREKLVKAEKNA